MVCTESVLYRYGSTPLEVQHVVHADLFSKFAGFVRVIENLVVEDGVVECKAKSYWMCWREIGLCNFHCSFVCFLRF